MVTMQDHTEGFPLTAVMVWEEVGEGRTSGVLFS